MNGSGKVAGLANDGKVAARKVAVGEDAHGGVPCRRRDACGRWELGEARAGEHLGPRARMGGPVMRDRALVDTVLTIVETV